MKLAVTGVAHADRQRLAETRDCVDLAAAHTVGRLRRPTLATGF